MDTVLHTASIGPDVHGTLPPLSKQNLYHLQLEVVGSFNTYPLAVIKKGPDKLDFNLKIFDLLKLLLVDNKDQLDHIDEDESVVESITK